MGNRAAPPFDEQSTTVQKYFICAATDCIGLGAKPRDYILAQFEAFERLSQFKGGRAWFPQPNQIHGLPAQARYLNYLNQKDDENDRSCSKKERMVGKRFFMDQRKLRGLQRVTRQPEEDILVQRPEEFSQEFLQSRGVWPLVSKLYFDRVG